MIAALLAVGLAWRAVVGGLEGRPVRRPVPGLSGTIVYASHQPTWPIARQRLWLLDLGTGSLAPGPEIPVAQELFATSVGPGWLVITTLAADGGRAILLPGLGPDAESVALARGDVFVLRPDGHSLIVGRSRAASGSSASCPTQLVEIEAVNVVTRSTLTLFRDRVRCGGLLSLGADDRFVYATRVTGGEPEILRIGVDGEVRRVLRGFALLSASPSGGLLVTDPGDKPVRGLGVWPGGAAGPAEYTSAPGEPTALWRGAELYLERVVTWSEDGSRAVVTGIVEDERNLWLIDVEGDGRRDAPLPLTPLESGVFGLSGATFASEGAVLYGNPGHLFALAGGRPAGIAIPPGAPQPAGPIAWLP